MYSTRVRGARDNQVRMYLESAEEALREDNPVSAANALRVAASLAPDSEEVRKRLDEVEQKANSKLASNYLDQAQYEEKEQHWELAAKSYLRAALGNPSARIHERVAHCLLKADGDMKLASEHGKKAVNLAPNQASMRVTLAEVYLKAGMRQSAIAEFERAQALAPHDDTIKDWLKRIRRNQV
jgi:tetratricopeptide (TPR) repeat protein